MFYINISFKDVTTILITRLLLTTILVTTLLITTIPTIPETPSTAEDAAGFPNGIKSNVVIS